MQQPTDQLRRTIRCDTTRNRLAFRTRNVAAANRTSRGHAKLLFFAGAFRLDDFHDFWNHVAAAFNQNVISDLQAESFNLVFVMKSRSRNGNAAELHRLEHRHRRQRSGPAHLHDDVVYSRRRLSRCVFIGNGPARGLAGCAKSFLESRRIHFHDDAVDLVTEIVAPCFHPITKFDHLVDRFAQRAVLVHVKTGALRPIQRIPMRREQFALTCKHVIGKHPEPTTRSDRRIELAHRSRCRVTWIGKARFACIFALVVDSFEDAQP